MVLSHINKKVWYRKTINGSWGDQIYTSGRPRWECVIQGQYNKGDIVCFKGNNQGCVSVVTAKIKLIYYPNSSYRVCYDYHMLDYFLDFKRSNAGSYIESQIKKAIKKGHIISETLLLCQILNTNPYHG